MVLAVNGGATATPLPLVGTGTVVRLPGKVTVTPGIGLPNGYSTVTWKLLPAGWPTVTFCPEPEITVDVGLPGLLVRAKSAGALTPAVVALTLKVPATVLAVSVGAVATPLALVVACTGV